MNAKLKILCTGTASYVELDGKTIGRGVNYIRFEHDAGNQGKPHCMIGIDLHDFEFMPDSKFAEVEARLAEAKPPENTLGRLA